MDPDEALKNLLEDLKEAEEGITKPERFYEQFEALHGWIAKGGFLPRLWRRPPEPPTLDAALDAVRSDYFRDVASAAKDVVEAMLNGEITDEDEVTERIESTCDSHCTYTVTAQAVLMCSKNDSVAIDDGVADLSEGLNWSALATWAMRADVFEALGHLEKTTDDLETDDPLEKYCDWVPISEEDDAQMSATYGEYEGIGDDRDDALAALRTAYQKRLGVPPVVEERPADG